jgi:hypothetical protein
LQNIALAFNSYNLVIYHEILPVINVKGYNSAKQWDWNTEVGGLDGSHGS